MRSTCLPNCKHSLTSPTNSFTFSFPLNNSNSTSSVGYCLQTNFNYRVDVIIPILLAFLFLSFINLQYGNLKSILYILLYNAAALSRSLIEFTFKIHNFALYEMCNFLKLLNKYNSFHFVETI